MKAHTDLISASCKYNASYFVKIVCYRVSPWNMYPPSGAEMDEWTRKMWTHRPPAYHRCGLPWQALFLCCLKCVCGNTTPFPLTSDRVSVKNDSGTECKVVYEYVIAAIISWFPCLWKELLTVERMRGNLKWLEVSGISYIANQINLEPFSAT